MLSQKLEPKLTLWKQNDNEWNKKMKKTGLLISALLITGIISGQTAFDIILKANALKNTGRPDDAITLLSAALKDKNDYRLFSEKADAETVKGDYSAAINDYNSANNLAENSGEAGLARVYALKGDAATSLYHLGLSMNSQFKKSEKEIMLDPAFLRIENRPEWRSFWKKDWYSGFEKGISEIEYYISANKTGDASAVLAELKKNYPDREDLTYAGALINLASGKYNDAVKSLTSLLETFPDKEKYLRTMAKAQTLTSNPAGASITYSRLIGLEVTDPDLLLLRSDCYKKTGEYDKAMTDITKYLSLYPDNKAALQIAGRIESAQGQNLKALEYFSENLKLHPNDPQCYIDRANSYFLSRSWDWAVKDYSMSLDLDPENSEAWLNKGIALANSGNTDDACHDFRIALSLGNKRATDYISRYCIK
jgi:tetratricopeptide (TPR) repeat protein